MAAISADDVDYAVLQEMCGNRKSIVADFDSFATSRSRIDRDWCPGRWHIGAPPAVRNDAASTPLPIVQGLFAVSEQRKPYAARRLRPLEQLFRLSGERRESALRKLSIPQTTRDLAKIWAAAERAKEGAAQAP